MGKHRLAKECSVKHCSEITLQEPLRITHILWNVTNDTSYAFSEKDTDEKYREHHLPRTLIGVDIGREETEQIVGGYAQDYVHFCKYQPLLFVVRSRRLCFQICRNLP